jgi:hypothetical protein
VKKDPASNAFFMKAFLALWVCLALAALSFLHFKLGIAMTRELLSKVAAIFLLSGAIGFFCLHVINRAAKNQRQR